MSNTLEVFCSICGRNIENHNEYISKESFRYQQAIKDICRDCLEDEITRHREDK